MDWFLYQHNLKEKGGGLQAKEHHPNREAQRWQHHVVGVLCCWRDWCSSQNRWLHEGGKNSVPTSTVPWHSTQHLLELLWTVFKVCQSVEYFTFITTEQLLWYFKEREIPIFALRNNCIFLVRDDDTIVVWEANFPWGWSYRCHYVDTCSGERYFLPLGNADTNLFWTWYKSYYVNFFCSHCKKCRLHRAHSCVTGVWAHHQLVLCKQMHKIFSQLQRSLRCFRLCEQLKYMHTVPFTLYYRPYLL